MNHNLTSNLWAEMTVFALFAFFNVSFYWIVVNVFIGDPAATGIVLLLVDSAMIIGILKTR